MSKNKSSIGIAQLKNYVKHMGGFIDEGNVVRAYIPVVVEDELGGVAFIIEGEVVNERVFIGEAKVVINERCEVLGRDELSAWLSFINEVFQ
ncbi:MAG: hypothetical protein QW369_03205 [Desulfurococcaceae archaeon]